MLVSHQITREENKGGRKVKKLQNKIQNNKMAIGAYINDYLKCK